MRIFFQIRKKKKKDFLLFHRAIRGRLIWGAISLAGFELVFRSGEDLLRLVLQDVKRGRGGGGGDEEADRTKCGGVRSVVRSRVDGQKFSMDYMLVDDRRSSLPM